MYTTYTVSSKSGSALNTPYVYGNDVTYSGGTYTLINTVTTTGLWASDYNTLNNYHYTCLSTETTCNTVIYIYYTITSTAYYLPLTNGNKIGNALEGMFNESNINSSNSSAKSQIDSWYNTNLSSYTDYLEDTVYCNDRSISDIAGWNPNGGDSTKGLYFSPATRLKTTYVPNLACSRVLDRFTVLSSNGNGALIYPVGLITSDEIMYAGGLYNTANTTYYLYNNQEYWTMSPNSFSTDYPSEVTVLSSGAINTNYVNAHYNGLRPVVSISATSNVESGDGTATNPYVIQTS